MSTKNTQVLKLKKQQQQQQQQGVLNKPYIR